MELVVVNGASNIAKRVAQSLLRNGNYNRIRLLDFKPIIRIRSLVRSIRGPNGRG